jgi:hypothetical protein
MCEVAVGMGRCGSIQGSSSYVTLGVSERLKVKVPELRAGLSGLVMLEAEFPLLWSRAWLDGACDDRSLAMAKRGCGDDLLRREVTGVAYQQKR